MHPAVKRAIPARTRAYLRRLERKVRVIRDYRVLQRSPAIGLRYLLVGRELDNFTYDIVNRDELALKLAEALDLDSAEPARLIAELDDDTDFRVALDALLAGRSDRPSTMPFGRRMGWYVAVRVAKPTVVIETGVHDGLGSALLLRALAKNAAEGVDGHLHSFDIRPDVGWLIPADLRCRHHMHIGDSLQLLAGVVSEQPFQVFVHDSDHAYEHETAELELVYPWASSGALLLSDNVHACTAFIDFCARNGLEPTTFRERPANHFYPGAGLGIVVTP